MLSSVKRNEIPIYRGTITGMSFIKTVRVLRQAQDARISLNRNCVHTINTISVEILRQVLDERKSYYCLSLQVAPLYCHSEFVKDE